MDLNGQPTPSLVVTGGTGFLGLHACNYFSDQGAEVTAVDLHPFQDGDDVGDVEFVQGDVRDEELMNELADGADAIIHAASAIPTWDDEKVHKAVVNGTRTTLDAAEMMDVDRVIYLSSAAVYGRRDDPPVTEKSPLRPRSVYGEAKLEAEQVCREYRERGLCVPVVRPQALIGRQRLGVFQILFDWVHTGANVPLVGEGKNKYQLLHVDDIVSALDLLLSADRKAVNTEFNLGAAEFGTMREDFQALIDHAGTDKRVIGTPAFLAIWGLRVLTFFNLSPLYPSLYETANEDTYLNVEKIQELGWEPEYSNKEALIDTYEWYRENFVYEESEGVVGNRTAPDQKGLWFVKKVFQVI
jgi:nucleoside-diphosphate-sugar epimerase